MEVSIEEINQGIVILDSCTGVVVSAEKLHRGGSGRRH
jgi:hypothetical protein